MMDLPATAWKPIYLPKVSIHELPNRWLSRWKSPSWPVCFELFQTTPRDLTRGCLVGSASVQSPYKVITTYYSTSVLRWNMGGLQRFMLQASMPTYVETQPRRWEPCLRIPSPVSAARSQDKHKKQTSLEPSVEKSTSRCRK